MYNTSSNYKTAIKKSSRSFECKVTIGDKVFTNKDIIDIKLDGNIQPSDGFSIGSTTSTTLDITLLNQVEIIYSTNQIKLEIGIKTGTTIEYLPMGLYNIDEVVKTDYTIKFTAFDNMIKFEKAYFSSLGDNPTLTQVVNELATKTGVQFTGNLPSYVVNKQEGFSCREILSYVASACGGNAHITRDGKFTIIYPKDSLVSISGDNYIDLKREDVKYKVGQVTCKVGEKNLTKGSLGMDTMELMFENPWVTESILTDIYNKLKGFEYLGYTMKWQGDLSLDLGDIITCTDIKGVVRKIPVLSQKFTYTGGLISEISAKGESKNKNSFSSNGSTGNKVDRLVTDQAFIKEAFIDYANINDADIKNLKVGTAKIQTAEIEIANINNLLAGKITGENIQAGGITSDKLTIANGFITNLMVANVDVSKLNAGDISTNKFKIKSDDGGIEIVGATQQFKDKNNKVRIQMGKDSKGDFNFIIRGSDGTTTLIDHTGVKKDAIANDLIVSDMIAGEAVGEKQVDYSSFTIGFNKDTNTSTIKGTKIKLDNQNQSLEVAFNSLKNQSDKNKETTASNSTTIGVQQGQITTAINNTQMVKDGKTILLKDDYSRTVTTVNSISSTIGTHTSQINGLNTTVGNQGSSIEQLKTKIALKVESADITKAIKPLDTEVTKVKSQVATIELSIDGISQKVVSANSTAENAIDAAKSMAMGKMLYTDPTFKSGVNGIGVYNNANNGVVTVTRITKPTDCPTTSSNCLEVRSKGVASPNYGGFYFATMSRANAIFITKIIAKIPVNRYINFNSNGYGTGGTQKWLTPTAGTGKYEEYICQVKCGATGTFSSTNYFSISGGTTPTAAAPLVLQVAYATVIDSTDTSNLESRINSAESKITPTSITNSVSEAINNSLSSINTVATVLDKTGLTVKNGGITIKNKSNSNVMWVDTAGYLTTNRLNVIGTGNNTVTFGGSGSKSINLKSDNNQEVWMNFLRGTDSYSRIGVYSEAARSYQLFIEPGSNVTNTTPMVIMRGSKSTVSANQACHLSVIGQITASGELSCARGYVVASQDVRILTITKSPKLYMHIGTTGTSYGVDVWTSDASLKKNIDYTKVTALDKIMSIEHAEYDWLDTKSHQKIGVIAQQLELIEPSWVLHVEQTDGSEILQPLVSEILPYITKAMQEQQEQILELKREIEKLKALS